MINYVVRNVSNFLQYFKLDVNIVNQRVVKNEHHKYQLRLHKNIYGFKYQFTKVCDIVRDLNNYHYVENNFVPSKYEVEIDNFREKKLMMDSLILIKPCFLPRTKILGEEFQIKQTVDNETTYKIGNIFFNEKQFKIYEKFKDNKNSLRKTFEKDSKEYNEYISDRKQFKAIMKKLNGEKKIHSRHFLGTGETLVYLKVMDGVLTFYVSLIHMDIIDNYYEKYLVERDSHDSKVSKYWRSDKFIRVLQKQSRCRELQVLDNMLINVNDFLRYLVIRKKHVVVIGPNIEMIQKCQQFQLTRICKVSFIRKKRAMYKSMLYKVLEWDDEFFVVLRNFKSYVYTQKKISLSFGMIDLRDMVVNFKKIKCINDYKYKMLLSQQFFGVECLPMIITVNELLVQQINQVIVKYRAITNRTERIISDLEMELSNEFAKVLEMEEFHANIFQLIQDVKPLINDVVAGHKKAVLLKAQFQQRGKLEIYENLINQQREITREMLEQP